MSVASKPGRFYRPELDALRFGAFLLVFITHWFPITPTTSFAVIAMRRAGALGVPVFFALSSYLITELLQREKAASGTVDLKFFYVRRILRIWPLYLGVTFGCFLASRLFHLESEMPISTLLWNVLPLGNIGSMVGRLVFIPFGFGNLWSIGVEEQFYLLWPAIVKNGDRRTVIAACFGFWIVSQISLVWLCHIHTGINPGIWLNTLPHLQYFAIGALVSLGLKGSDAMHGRGTRLVAIGAGLATFYAANYWFNTCDWMGAASSWKTYPGYLIAGVGTLLILVGALGAGVSSRSLAVEAGKRSYGLYVFHGAFLRLGEWIATSVLHMHHFKAIVTLVFGLGVTGVAAMLSYRYFEMPFLRRKRAFEIVQSRAA